MIVVGELRFGFQNGTRLAQNEELLERFLRTPRAQVLHITLATTWLYGEVATVLRARGVTLQQNDIWIAALCKQHAFALATRERGFQQVIGLQVIGF
jgi:predicted nucleic acid-binding protein